MNNKLRRPTVSYDELQREMRNTEDNDPEFCEWIESISVTKEQLETLISNPDYPLHQPKEQARVGSMFLRPRYDALVLLSRFPSRYTSGWKLLMKTLTGPSTTPYWLSRDTWIATARVALRSCRSLEHREVHRSPASP